MPRSLIIATPLAPQQYANKTRSGGKHLAALEPQHSTYQQSLVSTINNRTSRIRRTTVKKTITDDLNTSTSARMGVTERGHENRRVKTKTKPFVVRRRVSAACRRETHRRPSKRRHDRALRLRHRGRTVKTGRTKATRTRRGGQLPRSGRHDASGRRWGQRGADGGRRPPNAASAAELERRGRGQRVCLPK